ncbi:hypothetical protein OH764_26515 [Burkholderia sp. M6-3]
MAPHLFAGLRPSIHARQRERLAQRGWRALDRAMQQPSTYRHPAGRIRRIETHISVVYLAGRYAYKVKNPSMPALWISRAPTCAIAHVRTSAD